MQKVKDSLWETPMTHGLALATLASGTGLVLALAGAAVPGVHVYFTIALGVLAILAAILVLTGLQWRGEALNRWNIEKVGQWFASGVWLSQALIVFTFGLNPMQGITGIVLAAACIARAVKLHRLSRLHAEVVRGAIAEANRQRGD